MYGENDEIIPQQVQQKYQSLVDPESFKILKGASHVLLKPQNETEEKARDELFIICRNFLDSHLK